MNQFTCHKFMKFVLEQPEAGLILFQNKAMRRDIELIGKMHGYQVARSLSKVITLLTCGDPILFFLSAEDLEAKFLLLRQLAIRSNQVELSLGGTEISHYFIHPEWSLIVCMIKAELLPIQQQHDLLGNIGPILDMTYAKAA